MATSGRRFVSIQRFLFECPLYEPLAVDGANWGEAAPLLMGRVIVDGHCPECGRGSTFHRKGDPLFGPFSNIDADILTPERFFILEIFCARVTQHTVGFWVRAGDGKVEKVGQFPSFADIANDEAKTYRKILTAADGAEFHKAIGLAAHGVGVGSFVYLRRIFERLIDGCYTTNKAVEGWKDEDFVTLRMAERIKFLARHLPPFLVEHAEVYSVLSRGIHDLTEAECLAYFEPLKTAIVVILEDEMERRKKEELRQKLSKSIKAISSGGGITSSGTA